MKRAVISALSTALFCAIAIAGTSSAEQKGKPVYGKTDPSRYNAYSDCHKGAGTVHLGEVLGKDIFETNFVAVSRGEIPPGCGIGEHIHRHSEEVFIILNAPAQFTVNGRTAELPAGACVVCQSGSSHAVYNHTDETLQWLFFAVTETRGSWDAVDYNDDRSQAKVESPAPFR